MRKTLLLWMIPVMTLAAAMAGYALTQSSDSPLSGSALGAATKQQPSHPTPPTTQTPPKGGGGTGPTAGPPFTITPSAPLPALWPGKTQTVPVTISNVGPSIDVLTLGGSAAGVTGCLGSVISVASTSSFPINVPQGGSASAVMTITMAANAPRSCSGATFPITFTGTAGGPVTSR